MKQKLLVICGPTAVGKSELGVALALEFGGEVISADSHQIYRGLDIGTGKITSDEMRGVPHHCLDIADPSKQFTAADFKECAEHACVTLLKCNTLPILVGGTGFYIQAVVDDLDLPEVPPDHKLREQLEQYSETELYETLKRKDSNRAETIETDNKRRLIRALEVIEHHGFVPQPNNDTSPYDVCMIGLYRPRDELRERIRARTHHRLEHGMIEEARHLYRNGLPLDRMREIGLTYFHLAEYLDGVYTKDELAEAIVTAEWQYARKQLSWFRRDTRITWFHPTDRTPIIDQVRHWLQ